jgi:hypothetical protein
MRLLPAQSNFTLIVTHPTVGLEVVINLVCLFVLGSYSPGPADS